MEKNGKFSHILWRILPFIGLIVWGAFCITNNLGYDEAYTAALVAHPVRELIHITAQDVHAPFYYILLKVFYKLCGGGTHYWSLKVFSLLFMTAYLFLGKYEVKKLFGEQVSIYFMLFSILMPSMFVQAGNARMYAMGLFFFTAAALLVCDILQEATARKWILFCLCSIGSVYAHTFTMIQTFILYLIFFAVIMLQKKYAYIKWYLGSGLMVAVCYGAWLTVVFRQMQTRIETTSEAFAPNEYALIDYCKEWFTSADELKMSVMYLGIALTVFLGYYVVDGIRKSRDYTPACGMAILGLTALTGGLLSYYVTPCFTGRYIFPGFGIVALWYAMGMEQIASRKIRAAVVLIFLLCFGMQYPPTLETEYDKGMQEYEKFYEENVKPEDVIMSVGIHSLLPSVYHPERQYMAYGHLPEFSPFPNTTVFTDWGQLESVEGDIWICAIDILDLPGFAPYYEYDYENAFHFHYMYYDFTIYRLVPVE